MRRLRIYGFKDPPPSLPLFSGTLWTRIIESSRCRVATVVDTRCGDILRNVPK